MEAGGVDVDQGRHLDDGADRWPHRPGLPTILSHPAVPLALGAGLGVRAVPPRLLAAGMLGSVLPDADVVAFKLGIAYADALGHRGASHSITFALLLGALAAAAARPLRTTPLRAFAFVALATVSHPLLDAITDGGLGVALLWPLSDERFFAPWRVLAVSPLGIRRFISLGGLAVLRSEALWVWLPAAVLAAGLWVARRGGQPATRPER
jgi:inner membrane protein